MVCLVNLANANVSVGVGVCPSNPHVCVFSSDCKKLVGCPVMDMQTSPRYETKNISLFTIG